MVKKQKTAGIMTFHRSHNCGSILQSYATQQTLRNFGLKPEFIDFSNAGQTNLYAIYREVHSARDAIVNMTKVPMQKKLKDDFRSYDRYIKKHLALSKKSYTRGSELDEDELGYDYYLTGSDQVWNITIADGDDAYFLPFVKKHPKIAYAVSQGAKDIAEYADDKQKYKDMISDIDYLSVREKNGQKWLKDAFNIKSERVLDPTLLLDAKDYSEIEEDAGMAGKDYIFVYAAPLSKEFERYVRQVAKEHSLKIVLWHSNVWFKFFGWLKGYILPKKQNPGKYLDLMKNARMVFTGSFHGAIFAAQYRKDFWVFKNPGMKKSGDDRMITLLENFSLDDRFLHADKPPADVMRPVSYKKFEAQLVKDRKKSLDFLRAALKKK